MKRIDTTPLDALLDPHRVCYRNATTKPGAIVVTPEQYDILLDLHEESKKIRLSPGELDDFIAGIIITAGIGGHTVRFESKSFAYTFGADGISAASATLDVRRAGQSKWIEVTFEMLHNALDKISEREPHELNIHPSVWRIIVDAWIGLDSENIDEAVAETIIEVAVWDRSNYGGRE